MEQEQDLDMRKIGNSLKRVSRELAGKSDTGLFATPKIVLHLGTHCFHETNSLNCLDHCSPPQAGHRLIPCSFHSRPAPTGSPGIAMPPSTRSGSDTIVFHQSIYSIQCAMGVRQSSWWLSSGHRWLETGIPCASANAAARNHP